MNYKDFTATDFMSDTSFREWVCTPNAANSLFWEVWCSQYPDQQEEIELARQLLTEVQLAPHFLPQTRVDSLWAAIETEAGLPLALQAPGKNNTGQAWLSRMTAIFLGILAVSLGLALYRKS